MRIIIEIEDEPIAGITQDEVKEWVLYELGLTGCMSLKNPLSNGNAIGDYVLNYEIE